MSKNLPTVSVIIPARDAAGSLVRALASVEQQTYPNIIEVIVASADEPTSAVARANATVVDNPGGRTPVGLNLAIAASRGEVIVRCDAGVVLPPDYVESAVSTLMSTGADNVGGMQIPTGTTAWERAIAAAMSSRWGAGDARYRVGGEPGPVETVYLGVFTRQAIERVDGFDEAFTRTQDYELNHRIIETGGTVWFDPSLAVEYRPRGSLGALTRQYFEYGGAKRHFNRKHPGALRPRQLAPPLLTIAIGVGLLGSLFWPWLLVVPGAYLAATFGVALKSAASPWRTAAALSTMHLSWGAGFLKG